MKSVCRRIWCVGSTFSMISGLILLFLWPGTGHAAIAPTRIMPLGDSLTYGYHSSNGGGYRLPLWNDLVSQGASVNFVGSQQSGPANYDADNEGHPGWRIDQLSTHIVKWLITYQPQIILLHIGTNDILQHYDVPDAPTRLSKLISQITTTLPSAVVFVARIIPLKSKLNAEVVAYNAAIPGLVQAAGPNVHLVDMYDAVPASLLPDNVHPNDSGYGLMADVWYKALRSLFDLSSQSQQFSTDFEHGSPQPTSTNLGDASGYPAGGIMNVTGVCCGLTRPELGTRDEIAHSGTAALLYAGRATNSSGPDYAYLVGFDLSGLNLIVDGSTTLSYWIYPNGPSTGSGFVKGSNSTCVGVDLIFSNGTDLRDTKALDQSNHLVHPAGQCNHLRLNTWQKVTVDLGAYANGRTILRLDIGYDRPSSAGGYRGYLDDISIVG